MVGELPDETQRAAECKAVPAKSSQGRSRLFYPAEGLSQEVRRDAGRLRVAVLPRAWLTDQFLQHRPAALRNDSSQAISWERCAAPSDSRAGSLQTAPTRPRAAARSQLDGADWGKHSETLPGLGVSWGEGEGLRDF